MPSPLICLVRKESFCASHRLYNPAYDDEWNRNTYGKCSRENGHGHNYILEVSIGGMPDPHTGMIMDLHQLKEIIHTKIIDKVDHYHLNRDVAFLQNINPTTENFAIAIWNELDRALPKNMLIGLRLRETENNWVEIRGNFSDR